MAHGKGDLAIGTLTMLQSIWATQIRPGGLLPFLFLLVVGGLKSRRMDLGGMGSGCGQCTLYGIKKIIVIKICVGERK